MKNDDILLDQVRFDSVMADFRRTAAAHADAIAACFERVGESFRQLGRTWNAWLLTPEGRLFLATLESATRKPAADAEE